MSMVMARSPRQTDFVGGGESLAHGSSRPGFGHRGFRLTTSRPGFPAGSESPATPSQPLPTLRTRRTYPQWRCNAGCCPRGAASPASTTTTTRMRVPSFKRSQQRRVHPSRGGQAGHPSRRGLSREFVYRDGAVDGGRLSLNFARQRHRPGAEGDARRSDSQPYSSASAFLYSPLLALPGIGPAWPFPAGSSSIA